MPSKNLKRACFHRIRVTVSQPLEGSQIRNTWWFLSDETMQLMCFYAYVADIDKVRMEETELCNYDLGLSRLETLLTLMTCNST